MKKTSGAPSKHRVKQATSSKYGIVIFVVGLIMLVAGGGLLAWRLLSTPAMSDAEYLVKQGTWVIADDSRCDMVPCDYVSGDESITFTDYGKGTLRNYYSNSFDFLWTIEGGRLKAQPVQTDIDVENSEAAYTLDRNELKLTLKADDGTAVTFVPLAKD